MGFPILPTPWERITIQEKKKELEEWFMLYVRQHYSYDKRSYSTKPITYLHAETSQQWS